MNIDDETTQAIKNKNNKKSCMDVDEDHLNDSESLSQHSNDNKISNKECSNIKQVNEKQKIFDTEKKRTRDKKRKVWDSWTREEKVLFYEAIANGTSGARSLQNLFKSMNEKIGTKSAEKIRDYYYRAHKHVSLLLKNAGNLQINLKDKKEALCVLKCYGKMVLNAKNKKSSYIDTMKKLNKHPRLLKQVATHLKKMVTTKIKSLRKYKSKNEEIVDRDKKKDKDKELMKDKEVVNIKNEYPDADIEEKLNIAFQEQIKESNQTSTRHQEKIINETKNISLEVRK
jgi:hypothetical protein